jgi:uncharacterized protein (DUF433 family)
MNATNENIITREPGKCGGRPCIRGMGIAVADILGWLAAGMSHDEIIADFPELTEADIRAALAYQNPHIGESFDSFLREQRIYESVTATAIKRSADQA